MDVRVQPDINCLRVKTPLKILFWQLLQLYVNSLCSYTIHAKNKNVHRKEELSLCIILKKYITHTQKKIGTSKSILVDSGTELVVF